MITISPRSHIGPSTEIWTRTSRIKSPACCLNILEGWYVKLSFTCQPGPTWDLDWHYGLACFMLCSCVKIYYTTFRVSCQLFFGCHGQFRNVDLSLIKRLLCLWVTRQWMVPPERFELPTPGFVIQCSIQLSQGGKEISPVTWPHRLGAVWTWKTVQRLPEGLTLVQSEWRMDLTWSSGWDLNSRG